MIPIQKYLCRIFIQLKPFPKNNRLQCDTTSDIHPQNNHVNKIKFNSSKTQHVTTSGTCIQCNHATEIKPYDQPQKTYTTINPS